MRCEEKGTLVYCWSECKLAKPLWKAVRMFLQKIKTRTTNDLTILLWVLSGFVSKTYLKKITGDHVHNSVIHNSKDMKQPVSPEMKCDMYI